MLIRGNKTFVNKELEQVLEDEFEFFEVDKLYYSASDLVEKLIKNNVKTSSHKISEILKNIYQLKPKKSTCVKYHISYTSSNNTIVGQNNYKGRYYTFTKNMCKNDC